LALKNSSGFFRGQSCLSISFVLELKLKQSDIHP
jgi:hypothetical protein